MSHGKQNINFRFATMDLKKKAEKKALRHASLTAYVNALIQADVEPEEKVNPKRK